MADHALRRDLRQALAEVARPAAADVARQHRPGLAARPGRRRPHAAAAAAGQGEVTARRAALLTELEGRLELCPELRTALDTALVDEPPLSPRKGA